jgi:hypothetical protein
MTLEQILAAWIVGSSILSAAFSMVAVVIALHTFMDEAEATERRRQGDRLEAGLDGVDSARSEDADRAATLRVFRGDGSMHGNTRRGR